MYTLQIALFFLRFQAQALSFPWDLRCCGEGTMTWSCAAATAVGVVSKGVETQGGFKLGGAVRIIAIVVLHPLICLELRPQEGPEDLNPSISGKSLRLVYGIGFATLFWSLLTKIFPAQNHPKLNYSMSSPFFTDPQNGQDRVIAGRVGGLDCMEYGQP